MAVRFVLGRAGVGKTHYCVTSILRRIETADDDGPLVMLVPEQASFQMERTLALGSPAGGMWRAQVLSFSRLAMRVLDTCGHVPAALGSGARALALRVVAGQHADAVQVFGRAARTHGFFTALDKLIGELIGEHVSPEALRTAAMQLSGSARDRAEAIATLYAAYEAWLGRDRIDPGQRLALLRERVEQADWLRAAHIWVDGFASFTGQELETLITLARTARSLTISLIGEPRRFAQPTRTPVDPPGLFVRPEAAYRTLLARFGDAGVAIEPPVVLGGDPPPRFSAAPALAWLERHLAGAPAAGADSSPPPTAPAVRINACETHRDEVERAARYIRARMTSADGTLRFRDFAVIARDLDPFVDLIDDVFGRYGIPFFLDRRRPLGSHALPRFVAGLLDAVAQNLAPAPMVRLLRSGLLPLTRQQCEQLEQVVRTHEVRGAASWRNPGWRFGPHDHPEDSNYAARQALVDALEPLIERLRADTPPTGTDWARTLWTSLEALRVAQRIATWAQQAEQQGRPEAAAVHRGAWESLCTVLDDVASLLADTPLPFDELATLLRASLAEQTVGLAPPTLDQVLVGSIDRSRHPAIRYAWILGVNEGLFPARPADDTLLSGPQREALIAAGLPAPKPQRDDAFVEPMLFYIAATRASDGTIFSYAKADGEGRELFPSPLLAALDTAFPGLVHEQPAPDPPPTCTWELARGTILARAPGGIGRRRYDTLRARLAAAATEPLPWARWLRGLSYQNECEPIPGYVERAGLPAGVVWRGSASELEVYLRCPFKHFAKYGLKLRDPCEPEPMPRLGGTAAHEILARVLGAVMRDGEDVRTMSDDAWRAHLQREVERFIARLPNDLPQRRPRERYLTDVLFKRLEDVLLAHAARYRMGLLQPIGVECPFGRRSHHAGGTDSDSQASGLAPLAPLEIELESGERVQLTGYIDRIDAARINGRQLHLIYDYKSTPAGTPKTYLLADWLELFVYALALRQALGGAEDQSVAGVLVAPLYLDRRSLDTRATRQADETTRHMTIFKPRGPFDQQAATVLHKDWDGSRSPVAQMQKTRANRFHQQSDARPTDEMLAWFDLARRTITFAARGIVAGQIDVAPLVENRTLACQHCRLRPVCRYDPLINRARLATRALPKRSDDTDNDHEAGPAT